MGELADLDQVLAEVAAEESAGMLPGDDPDGIWTGETGLAGDVGQVLDLSYTTEAQRQAEDQLPSPPTRNGSSASLRHRHHCRPPRGSTAPARRRPPLSKSRPPVPHSG
jgi:hypothetical protein